MTTYTSSLPKPLLEKLKATAEKLNLPKNKIIERALEIYLDQINRAEYVKSYKLAGKDDEIMAIAEEGMAEYVTKVNKSDEAG